MPFGAIVVVSGLFYIVRTDMCVRGHSCSLRKVGYGCDKMMIAFCWMNMAVMNNDSDAVKSAPATAVKKRRFHDVVRLMHSLISVVTRYSRQRLME